MNSINLSIIIPCYNEKKSICEIIKKLKKLKNIKKQIILVDDGSTDGTKQVIKKLSTKVDRVIYHSKNRGKGAAIQSASKFAKGELIIIQDADLEYDPRDYYKLIQPFKNKNINVVYGSRVLGRKKFRHYNKNFNFSKLFRIFGNYTLTKISNFLNNQSLTDVHTCYKIFRKKIFFKLDIKENNFSFCPEVTTKLSRLSCEIIEVPIRYNGREIKEGKKIRFKDAISALITILKYRYFN